MRRTHGTAALFAALASLLLAQACANEGHGGAPGCTTTVPCAADSDCAALAGHRCNLAVDGGRCESIRCGGAGHACSDDVFCAGTDLVCGAGRCTGCEMCGDECVFLDRDDQHCGACGRALSRGDTPCTNGGPRPCEPGTVCLRDAGM